MAISTTTGTSIKVADEVWVVTALLHREKPNQTDFAVEEIVDRAQREGIERASSPFPQAGHLSSRTRRGQDHTCARGSARSLQLSAHMVSRMERGGSAVFPGSCALAYVSFLKRIPKSNCTVKGMGLLLSAIAFATALPSKRCPNVGFCL
jgi:hypothetical protein